MAITPQNEERLHSDALNEVISRPPSWIMKSGISIVFVITIGMLSLSYFINIPEIQKCSINFISKAYTSSTAETKRVVTGRPVSPVLLAGDVSHLELILPYKARIHLKIGQKVGVRFKSSSDNNYTHLSGSINSIANIQNGTNFFVAKMLLDSISARAMPNFPKTIQGEAILSSSNMLIKVWENIQKSSKF